MEYNEKKYCVRKIECKEIDMKKNKKRSGSNLLGATAFLVFSVLAVMLVQTYTQHGNAHDIEQKVEVPECAEHEEEISESDNLSLLEVHFVDVGQSDCTLIRNGEYAMLIDAGDNSMGTTVQNYLQKQGVEKLDYLVLTHTDADHIGGADVVITKFDISTVFMGDYEKDNATYRDVMDALEYKQLSWSTPKVGERFNLGDACFTIIAPNGAYDAPNNTSIGLIVEMGETRFIFTGDAEEAAETDMVRNGMDLSATVYKVGHHGSSSSTSTAFLDAMSPSYAVISCGKDNSYGYPHKEVMKALQEREIEIFRTDEQGSIVAVCDGESIIWNTE